MTSSIREFWRRLEGSVHPDDEKWFAAHPHTFNLDFPPPAFLGNVDTAPIIILMANGGYDPTETPTEFQTASDHVEHRCWLSGTGGIPSRFSPYYQRNALFPWVRDGSAVIVNAIAYRSPKISEEPHNQRVGRLLPSWRVHQQWLKEEVLPTVRSGKRRLVAHRFSLWDYLPRGEPNVDYSRNPASPHLSHDIRQSLTSWLAER